MEEPSEKKGSRDLVKLEKPELREDLTIRSAQPSNRDKRHAYLTPQYYGNRDAREGELSRAWINR